MNNQIILAYYLPQFHSIPENDIVFGTGFTDWDLFKIKNDEHLKSCKLPLSIEENGLGFYDPTLKEVREKQANLAKKYNVDGFIYYHFWLENHVVMNEVLTKLLDDNEPNIPFCICFANESWKHCYGFGKQVSFHDDGSTFRQLYDNPAEHALYLQKLFKHKNYLKINDKPILFIYKSTYSVYSYLNKICEELKKHDINDIYIVSNISRYCLTEYNNLNFEDTTLRKPNAYSPFAPHLGEYNIPKEFLDLPCIYSGYMGWNSKPRNPTYNRVEDFTPETITKNICKDLLLMDKDKNSPQIYTLFAWNEWSEGAIIEPNNVYGEELGYAIVKAKNNANFLKNIKFEYGIDNHYVDVTNIVYNKCIHCFDNNWYIFVPISHSYRDEIFSDPLPGIHKNIQITQQLKKEIYDEYTEIKIKINKLI
jgi:hypothetical protein